MFYLYLDYYTSYKCWINTSISLSVTVLLGNKNKSLVALVYKIIT